MLSAKCEMATDENTGTIIWSNRNTDSILMASCTDLNVEGSLVSAGDCVNGTLIPRRYFDSSSNYTVLNTLFAGHGFKHALDENVQMIPHDTGITIYDKTKVATSRSFFTSDQIDMFTPQFP